MKRGQVTVFMIVGIIILAVTAGIYFISSHTILEQTEDESVDLSIIDPIKVFVESCMQDAVIEGIYLTFAQGGYEQFPTDVRLLEIDDESGFFEVPYYFQNEQNIAPDVSLIEEQVALASVPYFLSCIDQFSRFVDIGYEFHSQDPIFTIDFSEGITKVILEYPLSIIVESSTSELLYFEDILLFDFTTKYQLIQDFLIAQEKDPNYLLVGTIAFLVHSNDAEYKLSQYGNQGSNTLLTLEFNDNLKQEPLIYNFGLGYNWEEQKAEIFEQLSIIPELRLVYIEPWIITQKGIHSLQLEAYGENITYNIDTDMLNINSQTGEILIDTNLFVNGEFLFYVRLQDGYGQELMAPLYLNININDGLLPLITPIDTQFATVGEIFSYTVNIENNPDNKPLFFDDTYSIFPIDRQTGKIEFTPTSDMVGTYSMRFDVENEFGKTWEKFDIEIK